MNERLRRGGKLLLAVLVAGVAGVMLLRAFEISQVYHPTREIYVPAEKLGRPFEEVWLKASDGVKVHGWFFPANMHGLRPQRRERVILLCHGNAGNITGRLAMYEALLETGVNVFTFDYRGYGKSEGKPDEDGTYRDTHAAYEWLRQRGFEPANIIVMGESLGGGVASELAVTEKVGGLILQCTFTSVPDLGAEIFPFLPVRIIGSIKYDTHSRLPEIHVPVMVMHSKGDTLIRHHHGERNFKAANEPKLFVELDGDHNDALEYRDKFVDGIEKFLRMMETKR